MNFPHRHWSPITRRHPASLQVANTNFLKNWPAHLVRTFRNFHCSFLFRGDGVLEVNARTYSLVAPCAFVIYPHDEVVYRAVGVEKTFDQLYYDFEPRYVGELERLRLVSRSRRIWTLGDPANLWALAEELCSLSNSFPLEQVVDRVDRLCERMLIESQLPPEAETSEERIIARILSKMRREPQQPFNLAETIRYAHMSEATFRRRWGAQVGMSPRRYLEQLRIQTACRLLIETGLPVREIARKVGFEDEFYFSRRFHSVKSCSPRAYRARHKV